MVECASRISRYIDSSVYRYESNSERRNRYVLELKLVAGGSQAGRNLLDSGLSSQITTAASITRLGVFVDSYDGCGSEIVLWSLPRTFFPSFAGSRSGQNIYTLHAKNLFISPLNCSTHRERTLACFTGGGRTLPRQLLQVQRRSAPSLTSCELLPIMQHCGTDGL
ncbi:hypothetical protein DOTSEDRAFT_48734 [Dothistroma septosporum NZE10]|uniref:Uncharacterized protein n=1 Tax=Dothistroma septosporum (strain NZE10 / CBS 128990) TaxID=675120 RepID=N1PEH8_DOTSN|nr:hypothetical protein DOTSEDRAFT_48734 [Dothistroma septosporum NZE10]